jgi:hypothetical protein
MSTESLVTADLGDGKVVLIEARASTEEGDEDVGIGRSKSFDGVVDSIQTISEKLASALDKVKPDSASIEFGVDVAVEAGSLTALIAKGSANATLKITLAWQASADGKIGG